MYTDGEPEAENGNSGSDAMRSSTVTIGIPACNEEQTIGDLLSQVADQTRGLERQIVVVSDGSTDRTNEIVAGFGEVELVVEAARRGKPTALNTIFRRARNGILVLIDADVVLEPRAIPEILGAFEAPGVAAVAARVIPMAGDSRLFSSLGAAKSSAWHEYRAERAALGRNMFAPGPMQAVRTECVTDLTIPHDTVNDDAYLASVLDRRGYRFRYCPTAVVRVLPPQKVGEFVRRSLRTRIGRRQYREFPEHLESEKGWRKHMWRIARKPGVVLPAITYLVFDAMFRPLAVLCSRVQRDSQSNRWSLARSTKGLHRSADGTGPRTKQG